MQWQSGQLLLLAILRWVLLMNLLVVVALGVVPVIDPGGIAVLVSLTVPAFVWSLVSKLPV